MQLRDWPLRKRLLFSNFIMIFIPVLFTAVVSIAIFFGPAIRQHQPGQYHFLYLA